MDEHVESSPTGDTSTQSGTDDGAAEKAPKPGRWLNNPFLIGLIILAVVLVAYGLLRSRFGPFLPKVVDDNFTFIIMLSALGIMVWNRKSLADKRKAAAKLLEEEEEAAAAKRVEDERE